jgi:hypothetical protein
MTRAAALMRDFNSIKRSLITPPQRSKQLMVQFIFAESLSLKICAGKAIGFAILP